MPENEPDATTDNQIPNFPSPGYNPPEFHPTQPRSRTTEESSIRATGSVITDLTSPDMI